MEIKIHYKNRIKKTTGETYMDEKINQRIKDAIYDFSKSGFKTDTTIVGGGLPRIEIKF